MRISLSEPLELSRSAHPRPGVSGTRRNSAVALLVVDDNDN
jgi:hypothetical protein